jgi:collagen type III alpha
MARNYSRDRLAQALMANMTRAENDPVPQRQMPPPIYDPAPQREMPMINDPAPAPFVEPPAAMPSAGGGGGGRGGGYVNPTSQVGYGYGWNGAPPPVAVNDPAPGFVPGAGNAPGGAPAPDLSALFGGQPYGNAGIQATGGYPSGAPLGPKVDPAPGRVPPTSPAQFASAASYGVPPGGTEPFFAPNDVYSAPRATPDVTPINPAVFGGQPYGLAAIAASQAGMPSSVPPTSGDPTPDRIFAPGPAGGSFDWSVYGLLPGGAPINPPTPPPQFGSAGQMAGDTQEVDRGGKGDREDMLTGTPPFGGPEALVETTTTPGMGQGPPAGFGLGDPNFGNFGVPGFEGWDAYSGGGSPPSGGGGSPPSGGGSPPSGGGAPPSGGGGTPAGSPPGSVEYAPGYDQYGPTNVGYGTEYDLFGGGFDPFADYDYGAVDFGDYGNEGAESDADFSEDDSGDYGGDDDE